MPPKIAPFPGIWDSTRFLGPTPVHILNDILTGRAVLAQLTVETMVLAMHHTLQWFIHVWSHGLRKGDEHPTYTLHGVWHSRLLSIKHRTNLSNLDSPSSLSCTSSIGSINSPLSSSITPSLFHSRLKHSFSANPSHRSLPFLLQD